MALAEFYSSYSSLSGADEKRGSLDCPPPRKCYRPFILRTPVIAVIFALTLVLIGLVEYACRSLPTDNWAPKPLVKRDFVPAPPTPRLSTMYYRNATTPVTDEVSEASQTPYVESTSSASALTSPSLMEVIAAASDSSTLSTVVAAVNTFATSMPEPELKSSLPEAVNTVDESFTNSTIRPTEDITTSSKVAQSTSKSDEDLSVIAVGVISSTSTSSIVASSIVDATMTTSLVHLSNSTSVDDNSPTAYEPLVTTKLEDVGDVDMNPDSLLLNSSLAKTYDIGTPTAITLPIPSLSNAGSFNDTTPSELSSIEGDQLLTSSKSTESWRYQGSNVTSTDLDSTATSARVGTVSGEVYTVANPDDFIDKYATPPPDCSSTTEVYEDITTRMGRCCQSKVEVEGNRTARGRVCVETYDGESLFAVEYTPENTCLSPVPHIVTTDNVTSTEYGVCVMAAHASMYLMGGVSTTDDGGQPPAGEPTPPSDQQPSVPTWTADPAHGPLSGPPRTGARPAIMTGPSGDIDSPYLQPDVTPTSTSPSPPAEETGTGEENFFVLTVPVPTITAPRTDLIAASEDLLSESMYLAENSESTSIPAFIWTGRMSYKTYRPSKHLPTSTYSTEVPESSLDSEPVEGEETGTVIEKGELQLQSSGQYLPKSVSPEDPAVSDVPPRDGPEVSEPSLVPELVEGEETGTKTGDRFLIGSIDQYLPESVSPEDPAASDAPRRCGIECESRLSGAYLPNSPSPEQENRAAGAYLPESPFPEREQTVVIEVVKPGGEISLESSTSGHGVSSPPDPGQGPSGGKDDNEGPSDGQPELASNGQPNSGTLPAAVLEPSSSGEVENVEGWDEESSPTHVHLTSAEIGHFLNEDIETDPKSSDFAEQDRTVLREGPDRFLNKDVETDPNAPDSPEQGGDSVHGTNMPSKPDVSEQVPTAGSGKTENVQKQELSAVLVHGANMPSKPDVSEQVPAPGSEKTENVQKQELSLVPSPAAGIVNQLPPSPTGNGQVNPAAAVAAAGGEAMVTPVPLVPVVLSIDGSLTTTPLAGVFVVTSIPGSAIAVSVAGSVVTQSVPGHLTTSIVPGSVITTLVDGALVVKSIPESIVTSSVPGSVITTSMAGSIVMTSVPGSIVTTFRVNSEVASTPAGAVVVGAVPGSVAISVPGHFTTMNVAGSERVFSVPASLVTLPASVIGDTPIVPGAVIVGSTLGSQIVSIPGHLTTMMVSGSAVVSSLSGSLVTLPASSFGDIPLVSGAKVVGSVYGSQVISIPGHLATMTVSGSEVVTSVPGSVVTLPASALGGRPLMSGAVIVGAVYGSQVMSVPGYLTTTMVSGSEVVSTVPGSLVTLPASALGGQPLMSGAVVLGSQDGSEVISVPGYLTTMTVSGSEVVSSVSGSILTLPASALGDYTLPSGAVTIGSIRGSTVVSLPGHLTTMTLSGSEVVSSVPGSLVTLAPHRTVPAAYALLTTKGIPGAKITLSIPGSIVTTEISGTLITTSVPGYMITTTLPGTLVSGAAPARTAGYEAAGLGRNRPDRPVKALTSPWYFVGAYLPTLLALVLRALISIVYAATKMMEPFYCLTKPAGALAKDFFNINYLSTNNSIDPFLAMVRGHWAMLLVSILYVGVGLLTPFSSEFLSFTKFCNSKGMCGPELRVVPSIGRILQGLLAFSAFMLVVFWYVQRKYKSGLYSDPSSIATMASLLHNSRVLETFGQIHPDATKREIEGHVGDKRYCLAFYRSNDNCDRYGIVQVEDYGQASPGTTTTSTQVNSSEMDAAKRAKLHKSRRMTRIARDIAFVILTCGMMALILVYRKTRGNTPFERFWSGQGFGPRFVMSVAGLLIHAQWRRLEREICIHEPFRELAKGHAPAKKSILVNRTFHPITTLFAALWRRQIFVGLVALAVLLSEVLIITLAGIPFNKGQLYDAFVVSLWISVVIMSLMLILLLALYLRPKGPELPRSPNTIASVFLYLYGSPLLQEFADLSTVNGKTRRKRIDKPPRAYSLRRIPTMDGTGRWMIVYDGPLITS